MLLRTHLAISFLVILLFLNSGYIDEKLGFAIVGLVATMLPDIDSENSKLGRLLSSRIIQFFVKHRGVIHSFSFCIIASFLVGLIYPILALPFFIGFSVHLFADSFTVQGIRPFWPLKLVSSGLLKTGSLTETSIFLVVLFLSLLILVLMIL